MFCLTWRASHSDQAKVSNFQVVLTLTREENVGRLQVTVDQSLLMNIDDCFQDLVDGRYNGHFRDKNLREYHSPGQSS